MTTALARTHHTARRKLRRRLEAEGCSLDEIVAQVEALRKAQGRFVPQPPRQSHYKPANATGRRRVKIAVASPPRATLDHVIPKSMDGPGTLDNLVLSCEPCNQARGGVHGPGAHSSLVGHRTAPGVRILPPMEDRHTSEPMIEGL